jgi:hypothetical protein
MPLLPRAGNHRRALTAEVVDLALAVALGTRAGLFFPFDLEVSDVGFGEGDGPVFVLVPGLKIQLALALTLGQTTSDTNHYDLVVGFESGTILEVHTFQMIIGAEAERLPGTEGEDVEVVLNGSVFVHDLLIVIWSSDVKASVLPP